MGKNQFSDIFNALSATKKPAEKVKILRENDSKQLRELLRLNFDKRIVFDLPAGDPPFKRGGENVSTAYTTLQMEWKRMYMFVKGGAPNLKPMKRESLFISLLESLCDSESRLLCEVKDKKLKAVTLKQVREAFPDFPVEK